MSGGFPQFPALCNGTSIGFDAANTIGTAVAPGTVNAKGSWTQLSASLGSDVNMLGVMAIIANGATLPVYYSLDIGIGGAGSEKIVVPDLVFNGANSWNTRLYYFPLSIPAGTRVAARCQASDVTGTDKNLYVCMSTFDSDWIGEGIAGYDALGFTAASTKGTQLSGSGSGSVKGAYTQLTASSGKDYAGFMASMDLSGVGGGDHDSLDIDIAIGGAGSEFVIVPDIMVTKNANVQSFLEKFISLQIPAATRISARYQGTDSNAANAPNLVFYGGYR